MELLLQFRLIKLLSIYNRKHEAPSREFFIDYINENRRNKFFYRSDSVIEYRNRINNTFGDCIAPLNADRKDRIKYYVAYDEDRKSLLVTAEGRKFTTWLGFTETFLKFHSRTKKLFLWILGTIILINWRSVLDLTRELLMKLYAITHS